jgi:hypothetical protein
VEARISTSTELIDLQELVHGSSVGEETQSRRYRIECLDRNALRISRAVQLRRHGI